MPFGNSDRCTRLGAIAVENPIRRPEKRSAGGLSVITVGPQLRDATAPLRHPTGISAPPDYFSVCRSPGLLQGFLANRSKPVSAAPRRFPNGGPHRRDETCCAGEQLRAAGRERQSGNGRESARNPGRSRTCRATDKPRQRAFPRPSRCSLGSTLRPASGRL